MRTDKGPGRMPEAVTAAPPDNDLSGGNRVGQQRWTDLSGLRPAGRAFNLGPAGRAFNLGPAGRALNLGPAGRAFDLLLAVALTAFAVVALTIDFDDGGADPTPLSVIAAVTGGLALAARRIQPVPVLVVVVVCRLLITWDIANEVALGPAAAVALYSVARSGDRRPRLLIALAAALVMITAVSILDSDAFLPEFLGESAQMLLPIAIADAARSRADRLRDLIDAEAEARVQAERLRIARDLHDVVAHGLSTIAVQSGVAAHLLDSKPEQAKEALQIINSTGKQSLEELRAMVGVLRSTDDAPLRPTPSDPDDLSDLIDSAANSGLTVDRSLSGRFPDDVSELCVVALHRIAQEALTNVSRHAGVNTAELSVEHDETEVRLTVSNRTGSQSGNATSTGVGIIGMRERAEALGGTLTTERSDGRFTVLASIPYHPRT